MSELDYRPTQRQTGFDVAGSSNTTQQQTSAPRTRTTTNGTIMKASDDDVEMTGDDELRGAVGPLPIPGSQEQKVEQAMVSTVTPSDVPTPPDSLLLPSAETTRKGSTSRSPENVKLPSLHSTLISPRLTAISSSAASHVSSGPASVSSSHWSPGRSSDPHLYSISAHAHQPYSYASVKPYLSTSFQTSAERAGPSGREAMEEDRDEHEEDVFGHTARGLGLHDSGEPSPPRGNHRPGQAHTGEMMEGEGDAAGVFSFSSPCFGPRSLEASDVPNDSELSPPISEAQRRPVHRVMSPGWTAATLSKLSLGGSPDTGTHEGTPSRLSAGPSHHSSMYGSGSASSLPSNANAAHRSSFVKRPPLSQGGPKSFTFSNSPSHALLSGPRSSSRNRAGQRLASGAPHAAVDDDETDDELMALEDDDATEDEGDQKTFRVRRARLGPHRTHSYQPQHHSPHHQRLGQDDAGYSTSPSGANARPGLGVSLHTQEHSSHHQSQTTTMSASYERAHAHLGPGGRGGEPGSLGRQYSSERHSALSLGRHHPYAASPSGASPVPAPGLHSYSPSSRQGARRRSSFGTSNGSLSASPAGGAHGHAMMHALSHSPRYASGLQTISTRDRPPGVYTDQHGGAGTPSYYPRQYHTQQSYGEAQESLPALGPRQTQRSNLKAEMTRRVSGASSGSYNTEEDESEVLLADEDDDDDNNSGAGGTLRGPSGGRSKLRAPLGAVGAANQHTASSAQMRQPASAGIAAGEVETPEMVEVSAIRERLGGAANCSAFISKLWYLMCRPEMYHRYIRWSESGDSVILSNDPDINNEFASEVLPKLFKHGNNASFVRQLNLYGFQRVPSSRLLDAAEVRAAKRYSGGSNISTALQLYGPHSSFAHPRFKKDQEDLLPSMKPRSSKKPKKGGAGGGGDQGGGTGKESDDEEYALMG
ncbi:hypothetical protein FA10DRAFT_259370 [Acaromyces ingoldii]|uniref:HSF-type DNA-binding domain-containing protein n=1 Tax=Acaromyces ingoldii TaxID=215250 RepID=A0A316YWF9_9BASI|nr:hypothetical protein FA10DRAFT_259370 [Acaromyces ingoldii]PWN92125.1 hypothetical protein FA10DRAFT_259370 [Acaromyces ingoldii]